MCRVLVSLTDNQIIHTLEDGQEFGRLERPPLFGVIDIPGVSVKELTDSLTEGEEETISQIRGQAVQRAISEAQEELRDAVDEKEAEIIIERKPAVEAEEAYFEYRLAQILNPRQLSLLREGLVVISRPVGLNTIAVRETRISKKG